MQHQINRHYSSDLCTTPGTYRINCGEVFYLGSTTRLGYRNSEHRTTLAKGKHPNKTLQVAYAASGHYTFTVLTVIPALAGDVIGDLKGRLKLAEQELLDTHAGDPCLANVSTSSTHNSTIGGWLAGKWQEDDFRKAQIKRLKAQKGKAVTHSTRKLMSEAKKGKNNVKSRPCMIHFNGESLKFDCVSDAAAHYGVTQQVMDAWLRGVTPWPGTGSRRPKLWSLTGMTGEMI
jgi:hypothetical protein